MLFASVEEISSPPNLQCWLRSNSVYMYLLGKFFLIINDCCMIRSIFLTPLVIVVLTLEYWQDKYNATCSANFLSIGQ